MTTETEKLPALPRAEADEIDVLGHKCNSNSIRARADELERALARDRAELKERLDAAYFTGVAVGKRATQGESVGVVEMHGPCLKARLNGRAKLGDRLYSHLPVAGDACNCGAATTGGADQTRHSADCISYVAGDAEPALTWDRRLAKPPAGGGPKAGAEVGPLDLSAPPRAYLQVDVEGDEADRSDPIPRTSWSDLTWHYERLGGQEVEYVRADLVAQQAGAVPGGR